MQRILHQPVAVSEDWCIKSYSVLKIRRDNHGANASRWINECSHCPMRRREHDVGVVGANTSSDEDGSASAGSILLTVLQRSTPKGGPSVSQRPGSCAAHLSPGKVMLVYNDDVVGAAFDKLLEGTPSSSISSGDSETIRGMIGDVTIPSSVYILPREVVYPGGSIDLATLLGS